jgi:hypothetical protein
MDSVEFVIIPCQNYSSRKRPLNTILSVRLPGLHRGTLLSNLRKGAILIDRASRRRIARKDLPEFKVSCDCEEGPNHFTYSTTQEAR